MNIEDYLMVLQAEINNLQTDFFWEIEKISLESLLPNKTNIKLNVIDDLEILTQSDNNHDKIIALIKQCMVDIDKTIS